MSVEQLSADECVADGTAVSRRILRSMRQTSQDNYIGDGGYRMQREYGLTPNGNSIAGRWVLRGPDTEWIDFDQYRHDLLARQGFAVA
jgi:hypothetical protein